MKSARRLGLECARNCVHELIPGTDSIGLVVGKGFSRVDRKGRLHLHARDKNGGAAQVHVLTMRGDVRPARYS